jgi:hypothetical protein
MTPLRFEAYPWSHSLLMVALWGFVAAALYRASGRATRAAGWVGALTMSHWILDFITHRPDMPVVPWGSFKVGLGLWNSVALTVAIEGAMFAGAVLYYARGRAVSKGFWALIGLLALTYAGNIVGPAPPSVTAIAVSMIALFPLVWWWGNRVSVR